MGTDRIKMFTLLTERATVGRTVKNEVTKLTELNHHSNDLGTLIIPYYFDVNAVVILLNEYIWIYFCS